MIMNAFSYYYIKPSIGPFEKQVKRTRGKFVRITEPMGCFKFRYAVFANRASELLIPLHDLTKETKLRIGLEAKGTP